MTYIELSMKKFYYNELFFAGPDFAFAIFYFKKWHYTGIFIGEVLDNFWVHEMKWFCFLLVGCGGILSGEEDGVITSPNYPNSYDRTSNCTWTIVADHSGNALSHTTENHSKRWYNVSEW
jgi:hypothetical protein